MLNDSQMSKLAEMLRLVPLPGAGTLSHVTVAYDDQDKNLVAVIDGATKSWRLTPAGYFVVIEKLALAIVPMDEGRRWVWNGQYGKSYDTFPAAIDAALQEIL